MKATISKLVWVCLVCASPLWCQAEDLPAFQVQIPSPKEEFRIEDLSDEQKQLCSDFRALAGQYRKPALEALFSSGAFPLEQKRITKAQVLALLGESESVTEDEVGYSLGFDQGAGHAFAVKFIDGRAAFIMFSKTL